MDHNEVIEQLLDNVATLAAEAAANKGAKYAEYQASAARQLAEAIAWLQNSNQPHGGNGSGND